MDISDLTPKRMRKGKNGKRGTRYYDGPNLVAKTCSDCGATKRIDEFNKAPAQSDGHTSKCRPCASAYQKEYHKNGPTSRNTKGRPEDRTDEEVKEYLTEHYPNHVKKCTRCHKTLPLDDFYQNKSNRSVVSSKCKMCTIEYSAERIAKAAEADPDHYKKLYYKYKEIWSQRTPEELKEAREQAFPDGTRECRKCGTYRPLSRFSVVPSVSNATATVCHDCKNSRPRDPEKSRQYGRNTRARRKERTVEDLTTIQTSLYPGGMKVCKKCHNQLPISQFPRNVYETDGLRRNCSTCRNESNKKRHRKAYESHWKANNIPFECYICQGPYEQSDHVYPESLGGSDEPHNRLPICAYHNGSKNGTPLETWLSTKHPELLYDVMKRVTEQYNTWPYAPTDTQGH